MAPSKSSGKSSSGTRGRRRTSSKTNRGRSPNSPSGSGPPPPPTWDERLINELRPWREELAGLLMFLLAVVSLFSVAGLTKAGWLGPWTTFWRQLFGWGVYPTFLSLAALGLHIALRRVDRPYRIGAGQVIGAEIVLLALLALTHQFLGNELAGALRGQGGGLIGWALSSPLLEFFGPVLTDLLHLSLLVWGTALVLRKGWADVIEALHRLSLRLKLWANELEVKVGERQAGQGAGLDPTLDRGPAAGPISVVEPPRVNLQDDELIIIDDSATGVAPKLHRRDKRLPPMEALEHGSALALTPEEIDAKKATIEQTLLDFGLPATVTEVRRGPAVTQFGVQPGYIKKTGPDGEPKLHKVRVGQIAALQRDLALALAVSRLRIEAPVPGRGIVGVEVPNAETSIVHLRPIIESENFYRTNSPLGVALGRDVAGAPVVTDLAKLPHLLIAGTTGSGKSVCLNALITCLVFNNTPERLKLVMIDPKKVELIRFNGLPHLLGKVETDGERVIGVLRWLTREMDRRYELLEAVGAKHLVDYNRKIGRQSKGGRLPYVAVFIDEMADLMATYPADVERTLCRLAQMARATGIHLVVATQRPSTDVITGLIKANFPARASFAVASGTDSRVILDGVGAEQLLGKGDMLFLPPDASSPLRIQGCFVADLEVEAVVSHWQKQKEAAATAETKTVEQPASEPEEPPWEELIIRQAFIGETDDMLEDAIALAKKYNKLSTSLIQRRLRVGYPRAARLMEALYGMGLVEDPKEGGRTRKTYVNEEDDPLSDFLAQ